MKRKLINTLVCLLLVCSSCATEEGKPSSPPQVSVSENNGNYLIHFSSEEEFLSYKPQIGEAKEGPDPVILPR